MNVKERLKKIVGQYAGDDLERAEMAFRGMSTVELSKEHGCSGQTRGEILEGYRKAREEWQEVYNFVCNL